MITYLQKVISKAHEPKSEIIPLLLKNLGKEYPERSHKTVHASDVTKESFCPRQYSLMDTLGLSRPPTYIAPALKATFDMGNAASDLMREEWLGQAAVGNWRCTTCGVPVYFQSKPTGGCTGKSCNWKYEEMNFVDPTTQISGSVDVFVGLKGSKLITTEIKIMKTEDFEKLKAPLAEHRIRTSLYMKLIAASGTPASLSIHPTLGKVLYISRGFGKKSDDHGHIIPFKEFDVVRDDDAVVPYLEKPLALANWRAGKGPRPAGICPTPSCTVAKKCQVREACFSGDYPS